MEIDIALLVDILSVWFLEMNSMYMMVSFPGRFSGNRSDVRIRSDEPGGSVLSHGGLICPVVDTTQTHRDAQLA